MEISLTEKKLKIETAGDVNINGNFGYALDVDNNYAIVTKKGHQENFNTSYIFKKTDENWNMLQDISGQPIGYDGFGMDAKIKNDIIMVSSRTYYSDAIQRVSNEKGGIHVYKLNNSTDKFEAFNPANLDPTDKSTYGYDNAGNYDDNWGPFNFPAGPDALPNVLVPGPNYDGNDTTQFYKGGIPDNPNSEFSTFFDLYYSNNIYTVIVGHPGTNEFYIFRHDENDASKGWLRWKYNPSTVGTQNKNYDDVAIFGDYVFLSYTSDNSNKGKVIIYKYDSTQANFADKWQKQTTDLVPDTQTAGERFGRSLSVYDDYLIVGTENEKAYIYKKDVNNEWTNTSEKVLTPKTVQSNARFGITVSIGKHFSFFYAVVGSTQKTVNGQTNEGSFYLYRLLDDEWTQRDDNIDGEFVHAIGDNPSSTFSSSLSIKNNQIIVGASAHSTNTTADNSATTYTGAAYIFLIDDLTPDPLNIKLRDLSNNFLISSSLVTTKEIDYYFKDAINIKSFNQTDSNTFFTDLSNNSNTNSIMSYIGFKIVKITSSLGELVTNSLYTSLDTENDSFTFDNLVDVTAATIFDASNNADISVGDTTPTTNEKEIFKAAKTLSFRKLRKDLKSTELETKIKDISTTDVDANITTYLNTINQNLSLNLTGFDLSGVDLTGTDLSGATLVDTDLSGANLTNANFTYVDISGADITNTNLKNSTFTDISNVQNATGVALNVPYRYQYFNNQLRESTTNLTQSYTTNKTKLGPFRDGEKITVNGIQIVLGTSVSEAGLLGVNTNQDGDSYTLLQDDNKITSWGNPYTGGNQPSDISNVKAIFSSKRAKSALCENGKVFSWGDSDYGADAPTDLNGIIDIKSNEKAFVGLYHNGSIVCWGDADTGGTKPVDVSNVVQLYSNKNAFTALSSDGTIKSWGSLNSTTPPTDNKFVDIFSTTSAFAGLKSDGTVKCWGSSDSTQNTPPIGLNNVSVIFSNETAFAALLGDSTVKCWGDTSNGGTTPTDISNVDTIYCTNSAFTALLNDGNIVCWGDSNSGGTKPTSIDNLLSTETPINVTSDACGNFIFQDISSTELNLSFRTNHTNVEDRTTGLGFISGNSLYFKERDYDANDLNNGRVFISDIEFDTNVKDHTFVFKTFPYKSNNSASSYIYIGFIRDDGNDYTSYGNKNPTSIFTSQSNKNPYIYLSNPSWMYSGQHELTFTLANDGLTVTGGSGISINNGSNVSGGKYKLVLQVNDGSLQLTNAFSTPYPKFEYGKKYKFDQSDSSNAGYTLKFSSSDLSGIEYERSESFGTPGSSGAYTTLCLTDDNIQQLYTYSSERGLSSGKNHKVIQFEIKTFIVTVDSNKFIFDGDQNIKPSINHNALYKFDVSHSSNIGFKLSFSKDNTTTNYNVNRMGTPGSANALVTFKNNDIANSNFYVFDASVHGLDAGSHYNPINIGNITQESVNNFEKVFSTQTAFAGLKKNGKIVTWGNSSNGGSFPKESTPQNLTNKYESDITDVVKTGYTAFTAININDGLMQSIFNIDTGNEFSMYSEKHKDKLTYDISKVVFTTTAFGVLRKDGMVIAFGSMTGQTHRVQHRINSNCIDIVSNEKGFCVLKNDGTVVTWGDSRGGGVNSDLNNLTNVKKVVATQFSFAALKNDGSVEAWGYNVSSSNILNGTVWDTSDVVNDIKSGVIDIYSNKYNVVAIKDDGTGNGTYKVITWGYNNASSSIKDHGNNVNTSLLDSGIKKVVLSTNSGVIIKSDNNAYVWGDIAGRMNNLTPPSANDKLASLTNIKEVRYSSYAIAFLKYDGSVVCWGGWTSDQGGKVNDATHGVRNYAGTVDPTVLDSNIVQLYSNSQAFCALSSEGKVYCWGDSSYGGNPHNTSHGLPPHLNINDLTDIVKVTGLNDYIPYNRKPYRGGFAALKKNGQIVYWGVYSNSITGARFNDISKNSFVDICNYPSDVNNYFALHSDGTIHGFGYDDSKRNSPYINHSSRHRTLQESSHFQAFVPGTFKAPKVVVRWDMERCPKYIEPTTKINENFENVFATDKAFAAIKKDGTIIVWGNDSYGGKQSDVTGQYGVRHIFSNTASFTALKQDNTQIIWGSKSFGSLGGKTTDINVSSNIQEINEYIEPYRKSNLLAMYGIHVDTRKILEESYNSNQSANIILKTDGTATTWGNTTHGGVSSNLTLTNVKEVVTGGKNMTVLKSDGTMATWSNNTDQSTTATNVKKVVSGLSGNVIALKADGTVEYWHPDLANWDISSNINTTKLSDLSGVVDVFAFDNTFAALDKNDALTVWGDTNCNIFTNIDSKSSQLTSGIKEVIANSKVLIALKYDGTVVTLGNTTLGGDISNNGAQYKLYGGTADNIANIYLNNKFAIALKKDRTCVYWGDISRNTTLFNTDISAFKNIRDIVYSKDVMVGIKYDGTIVGLGEKSKGGETLSTIKNVERVFATTNNGFTALKTDGSFSVWGDTSYGGQL